MKKKLTAMFIMTLMFTALIGCNKNKDTGVVVSASISDSGNKESDTQVAEDTQLDISGNDVEINTNTETTEGTIEEDTKVPNEKIEFLGTWVTTDGNIMSINGDSTVNNFNPQTSESKMGIYETDYTTYFKITYEQEATVTENESGETVVTPNNIVVEYKITSLKKDDNGNNQLTLNDGNIELVFTRDASIPSNSQEKLNEELEQEPIEITDYSEEDEEDGEFEEMTPEEEAAYRQFSLEQGIDPDTGLPIAPVPGETPEVPTE